MNIKLLTDPDEALLRDLLEAGTIVLKPDDPFTFSSGLKSPIYCDNRETLSLPKIRKGITELFVGHIRRFFPDVEVIAGVSTGAIAQAALIAEALGGLPMVYVRSEPKEHGKGRLVEGKSTKDKKTVVIEDLLSTGKSSLNVVRALREEGANVLGMGAIFTYDMQKAILGFEEAQCPYFTLGNISALLEVAVMGEFITSEQKQIVTEWQRDPQTWSEARGGILV